MTPRRFATLVLGAGSATFAMLAAAGALGYAGGLVTSVVLGLAALLTASAMRLDDERRTGVAVALLTVAVLAWATDFALLLRPVPASRAWLRVRAARQAHVDVDPRSPSQVAQALRHAGVDAWPTPYPDPMRRMTALFRDTLYPLGAVSGSVAVMCSERGPYVLYRADEHGFTNPAGQWRLPRTDLALVGDSYAMGWCVQPRDAFASLIRSAYPATIVLGMGASGTLQELAMMREYLPAVRPRLVLWFYYESNDLLDLDREKTHPMLKRYLDAGFSQHLAERQAEVDRRLREYLAAPSAEAGGDDEVAAPAGPMADAVSVLSLAHLRGLVRRVIRPVHQRCCDLALFEQVVRSGRDMVQGWGGQLAVVYLPSEGTVAGRPESRPAELAGDSVVALLGRLSVPVLDLRKRMGEFGTADQLFLFPNSHYSARGHRAVAALVVRYLAARDSLAAAGRSSGAR